MKHTRKRERTHTHTHTHARTLARAYARNTTRRGATTIVPSNASIPLMARRSVAGVTRVVGTAGTTSSPYQRPMLPLQAELITVALIQGSCPAFVLVPCAHESASPSPHPPNFREASLCRGSTPLPPSPRTARNRCSRRTRRSARAAPSAAASRGRARPGYRSG